MGGLSIAIVALPSTFSTVAVIDVVDVGFVVLGNAVDPCQRLADTVHPRCPRGHRL
jgi:hypothetical protein